MSGNRLGCGAKFSVHKIARYCNFALVHSAHALVARALVVSAALFTLADMRERHPISQVVGSSYSLVIVSYNLAILLFPAFFVAKRIFIEFTIFTRITITL